MAAWCGKGTIQFVCVWMLMALMACSQTVTVYWARAGSGPEDLAQDMEECRSLQRAVGNDEDRIDQCLMVKGWAEVKKEHSGESSTSP